MKRPELDQLGAVASFACAIHCALIPILISLSAGGAISLLDNQPVEWGLVLLAAVVGTTSAWRGYRVHGNKTVAVVLVAAIVGLILAAALRPRLDVGDPDQVLAWLAHRNTTGSRRAIVWIIPVIGTVIAVAHIVNLRLCRACRACDAHEHESGLDGLTARDSV